MSDIKVTCFMKNLTTNIEEIRIWKSFHYDSLKVSYRGISTVIEVSSCIINNKEVVILRCNDIDGLWYEIDNDCFCIDDYLRMFTYKVDFFNSIHVDSEDVSLVSNFEMSTITISINNLSIDVKVKVLYEESTDQHFIELTGINFASYRCGVEDTNMMYFLQHLSGSSIYYHDELIGLFWGISKSESSDVYSEDEDLFKLYDNETFDLNNDLYILENDISSLSDIAKNLEDKLFNLNSGDYLIDVTYISLDMSSVEVFKLVSVDDLVGYRFKLNRGYLDISAERGMALGLSPYRVIKEIQLKEHDGLLVTDYEIENNCLVKDVSDNTGICNDLVKNLLVPTENW